MEKYSRYFQDRKAPDLSIAKCKPPETARQHEARHKSPHRRRLLCGDRCWLLPCSTMRRLGTIMLHLRRAGRITGGTEEQKTSGLKLGCYSRDSFLQLRYVSSQPACDSPPWTWCSGTPGGVGNAVCGGLLVQHVCSHQLHNAGVS